ncbi:spindle pole body formation-associated protein-domain-containing protein [Stachybotrys elegans]|uniref:Spindle pole body formation-associated protein-domain-containing protein n=1 Tax=Stachybotrys elegans TaxID=80388 RepID=A0A8K0WR39_9HYPO|nr:spindle pole body formation-associated protein-domain-containing protein [Stachybotrys elegans]
MLGWMLKRGDNAPVARDEADVTDYDQPDTPAPVFAARAIKSALFGTPAPREARSATAKTATAKSSQEPEPSSKTPPRPQGILLTPGTGTTRRKRVSFGHDLVGKAKSNDMAASKKTGDAHRRSRLTQALEDSRSKGGSESKSTAQQQADNGSEDEWEEEDEDDHCHHDITLDLNEPRSQSGQYWKDEFKKYQQEAKVEMEKLLRYKQLAKSYAHEKDAEAIKLAEMLRDEQQKVIQMEKKIVENASNIVSKRERDDVDASSDVLSKLAKQTAQAVQYRQRVQELEEQLERLRASRNEDDDAAADAEASSRRRRQAASPRTQKTIMETQRELRRARSQLKEMNDLREQVSSLKAQLRAAKRQASSGQQEETNGDETTRAQLRQAREQVRSKDKELEQLKEEFEAFRKESQAHDEDTRAVLERAHVKIAELKKEVRTLKATNTDRVRPNSWHPNSQDDDMIKDVLSPQHQGRSKYNPTTTGGDSIEVNLSNATSRTLREKFQQDSSASAVAKDTEPPSNHLENRPRLQQPRWQPFVPRSPRNRAYLGEGLSERAQNGASITRPKSAVPDLPALAKSIARSGRRGSMSEDEPVDLVHNDFRRLGGGEVSGIGNSTILGNTSKSILPPERRAAAIARIEQRMAEKKAQRRAGHDKENVRP